MPAFPITRAQLAPHITSYWHNGTGVPGGGLGVDDDYYLDDATGDVYRRSAGSWSLVANILGPAGATGAAGAAGAAGADGADGVDGSTWYDGSGAPGGGLGIDGDYYLDDATGNVYLKAAGTWGIVANIKGATGAAGAAGAAGPSYYPSRAIAFHRTSNTNPGSSMEVASVIGTPLWGYAVPGVDGDWFTNGLYIKAGTYEFQVVSEDGNDRGIVDFEIDGVYIGTLDFYLVGTSVNQHSIFGVTITGDGWHVVKGTTNGKNVASSDWLVKLHSYELFPSTDTEDHS